MSTVPISVVLCTYQGEQYLAEQLISLLTQTCKPSEIVIFDDASSDGTWALLQDFQQQAVAADISVHLHQHSENQGYVKNFTAALRQAKGELVFLCDQDDIWHKDKLEKFVKLFELRPELLMLHADAQLVDSLGNPLDYSLFEAFEIGQQERQTMHAGLGFGVLLRRNIATGAAMAIRREVLAQAWPIPEGWIHDEWLAMVASMLGQIDCLEEKVLDYRQHGDNQIGAKRRSRVERITGGNASRSDYLQRMRLRLESLLTHIEKNGISLSAQNEGLLLQRLTHARFREVLPKGWVQRVQAIWQEYQTGRYQQFSSGLRSVMSDLVGLRRDQ